VRTEIRRTPDEYTWAPRVVHLAMSGDGSMCIYKFSDDTLHAFDSGASPLWWESSETEVLSDRRDLERAVFYSQNVPDAPKYVCPNALMEISNSNREVSRFAVLLFTTGEIRLHCTCWSAVW